MAKKTGFDYIQSMKRQTFCTVCFYPIFSLLFTTTVLGQSLNAPMSDSSKSRLHEAILLYQKNIGNRALIYMAPEYARLGSNAKGHPFYDEKHEFNIGSVDFGDVYYEGLNIGYDIFSDKLILIPTDQSITLEVQNEKVNRFAFNQHVFIRLVKDSLHQTLPITGYYELLLDGKYQVLARHTKKIEYPLKAEDYRDTKASFVGYSRFFIAMNNTFYEVKHQRNLFDLFPEEKNEIRQWMQQSPISFRTDPRSYLIGLIQALSKGKL